MILAAFFSRRAAEPAEISAGLLHATGARPAAGGRGAGGRARYRARRALKHPTTDKKLREGRHFECLPSLEIMLSGFFLIIYRDFS